MSEQQHTHNHDNAFTVTTVETLLALPQEEYDVDVKEFVAGRVETLTVGAPTEYISGEEIGGIEDFIPPNRNINFAGGIKTLVLDDIGAYAPTMQALKLNYDDLKQQGIEGETLYINAALRAANNGQAVYFGSWVGNLRESWLSSFDILGENDDQHQVSISDVGRKAVCIQRASLSHNALKILGVDSRLMFGELAVLGADTDAHQPEWHAVVVIKKSSGEYILFDPTNPKAILDKDGAIYTTLPTAKKLGNSIPHQVELPLSELRTDSSGKLVLQQVKDLQYTLFV